MGDDTRRRHIGAPLDPQTVGDRIVIVVRLFEDERQVLERDLSGAVAYVDQIAWRGRIRLVLDRHARDPGAPRSADAQDHGGRDVFRTVTEKGALAERIITPLLSAKCE